VRVSFADGVLVDWDVRAAALPSCDASLRDSYGFSLLTFARL
jgi:hypothetical protein